MKQFWKSSSGVTAIECGLIAAGIAIAIIAVIFAIAPNGTNPRTEQKTEISVGSVGSESVANSEAIRWAKFLPPNAMNIQYYGNGWGCFKVLGVSYMISTGPNDIKSADDLIIKGNCWNDY